MYLFVSVPEPVQNLHASYSHRKLLKTKHSVDFSSYQDSVCIRLLHYIHPVRAPLLRNNVCSCKCICVWFLCVV